MFSRTRVALAQLSPSVWRILLHSLLFGLAISIADLLFNFYLVSLGYAADVAGLLSMVSRLAGALLGLPIGYLIDRTGSRRALLVGVGLYALGWVLLLLARELWALLAAQFLAGAAQILALTAVVPLLTQATRPDQRAGIFGLNASASLVIGLVGSAVGGLLPSLAAGILQVGAQATPAYRLALLTVIAVAVAAALPLLPTISTTPEEAAAAAAAPDVRLPFGTLLRFALPALFLGIAGGALLPFQNLFFRQVFGLNDALVGAVLASAAVGMGVGGLVGAPISARIGLRRAAAWLRLGALPAMLLMLLPALAPAAVGFFFRGLFVAASFPLNDALIMLNTPARQRGIATSLTSILWAFGWAVAAALSGWVQLRWGFGPVLVATALAYGASALAIVAAGTRPDEHPAPLHPV